MQLTILFPATIADNLVTLAGAEATTKTVSGGAFARMLQIGWLVLILLELYHIFQ